LSSCVRETQRNSRITSVKKVDRPYERRQTHTITKADVGGEIMVARGQTFANY